MPDGISPSTVDTKFDTPKDSCLDPFVSYLSKGLKNGLEVCILMIIESLSRQETSVTDLGHELRNT